MVYSITYKTEIPLKYIFILPNNIFTVEPRCNEGLKVLFYTFRNYWGKENRSLYRGLRYIEVRYIEVFMTMSDTEKYTEIRN